MVHSSSNHFVAHRNFQLPPAIGHDCIVIPREVPLHRFTILSPRHSIASENTARRLAGGPASDLPPRGGLASAAARCSPTSAAAMTRRSPSSSKRKGRGGRILQYQR